MTGFFALLRLQLLSRLADLKPRNFRAALKEKKGRTIGMAILIVFLVIYLGTILFIVENKMLDVLMKMGTPDMRLPIAHCLTWPKRVPSNVPFLQLEACQLLVVVDPDLRHVEYKARQHVPGL